MRRLARGSAAALALSLASAAVRAQPARGWPEVSADSTRARVSSESVSAAVTRSVPARADSTQPWRMPEVEVRAHRLDRQSVLDAAPGFGSVLTQSSWSGGVSSTASALAGAVGVNVRETGGIGSYSTISLRGSTAGQVPVYLDGVPLNAPRQGDVDLADVPLSQLERIEVYRGCAPLTLGGASLGGAVHLYSAARGGPPWLTLTRSSFSTAELQGGAAARLAAWTLAVRGRAVRTQGDWSYPSDNGTPYNPDDDHEAVRANNDLHGGGGLITLRRPVGGWLLRLSDLLDGREQGIPGNALSPALHARSESFTQQAGMALERPAGWLRSLEAYHRIDRQGFTDPTGELGLGAADRRDVTSSAGATVGGALAGARGQTVTRALECGWRAELHGSRLESTDARAPQTAGAPQTRWTLAAALEPKLALLQQRLIVVGGARLERHDDRFHGVPFGASLPSGPQSHELTWGQTWQLGAQLALCDELALKLNVGDYDRVPTLLERFGARGTVIGNAALLPEHGVNRDCGVVWSRTTKGGWDRQRLAVSLFHNDASDLIAFVRNSQRTAVPLNVGAAEIQGVEVELALGRAGQLTWEGNFTRLLTRDRTDHAFATGKQLPGRPGYELSLRVGLGAAGSALAGSTGPAPALGYELTALGDDYLDRANRDRVPARLLHSLLLQAQLPGTGGAALLCARVENLTDEQVYDLAGWPLPGRAVAVSLSVRARERSARSTSSAAAQAAPPASALPH